MLRMLIFGMDLELAWREVMRKGEAKQL